MKSDRFVLISFIVMLGLCSAQSDQQTSPPSTPKSEFDEKIPVMDGGAGPCSLELAITSNTKPVPAANVKVHIAYGFGGMRKLDLEAYANNYGKLRFTGLPSRVKSPPLTFRATKDNLAGIAVYDPESECNAKHELTLVRQKESQN